MKTFAVFVAAIFLFIVGIQIGIHHGRDLGYDQGWHDANCGPGRNCESGDN